MFSPDLQILWLTENYPPSRGGMSQSCDRIVYGLRGAGIPIHVVHFTNRAEGFRMERVMNGTYTAIPVTENEAHTLNLCWNFLSGLEINFTRLVVFGGYLPMIGGPVFARWMGIPLVTLLRGNDFDISVFSPRRKNILEDALTYSDRIVCVTKAQAEGIKKLFHPPDVRYLPNGICTRDWEILKSEQDFAVNWRKDHAEGELVLGFFGQIKEKKGFDILLKALTGLMGRYFLLLAGDYEETVPAQLSVHGIRYELLPFIDRNELVRYYACCHLVVIPSHYEGMPNVLLEAGALGVPVIASSVGGIMDVMSEQFGRWLFRPGNAEALKDLLFSFYDLSETERNLYGIDLKKYIHENFNCEIETAGFIRVLTE